MSGLGMANEQHHKIATESIGPVQIYIQGTLAPLKPVFLTIHDLGCNHYQYEDFVGHWKMAPIMQRSTWIHLDLPGQGDGDEDLPSTYTFPPITKLPEAIKEILDHFKVKQVVLFGEGAGANILARFAIMYDHVVLGAILINCTGTTASVGEAIKDKLINWKLNVTGMNPATESFLIVHRFGPHFDLDNEIQLKEVIENFRQSLRHSINPRNLNKFINSYMQRKNLTEYLSDLRCSVLLITGSLASQRKACRQFYEELCRKSQMIERNRSTGEFVVIDGVTNVLAENAVKVIAGMQLFLQGIGLLSNLNLQKSSMKFNRRMSMQDYDRPLGKLHYSSYQLSEDAETFIDS